MALTDWVVRFFIYLSKMQSEIDELSHCATGNSKNLRSLELFAGAGGLALGVHYAGFQNVGLVENNSFAVDTLRENCEKHLGVLPDQVISNDVRFVDFSEYKDIDLLSGGPPCQPFSTAGLGLGEVDDRNMFPAFIDVQRQLLPKALLIENVRGLYRTKFRDYFSYLLLRLKFPFELPRKSEGWIQHRERLEFLKIEDFDSNETYIVDFQLVDAADYGIPQRRHRVLISAFRRDLNLRPVLLKRTHSREELLWEQWVTGEYWERHSIAPIDNRTEQDKNIINRLINEGFDPGSLKAWKTVRDAISSLPPPVLRGEIENYSNHVQVPGARIYPCHVGSFYDSPSKALKAGTHGTPGGENCVWVPNTEEVRYYTTREAARLQTFPEEWHFHGSWGACIKQLGNAVPVELIRDFASAIREELLNNKVNDQIEGELYDNSGHYATPTHITSPR